MGVGVGSDDVILEGSVGAGGVGADGVLSIKQSMNDGYAYFAHTQKVEYLMGMKRQDMMKELIP